MKYLVVLCENVFPSVNVSVATCENNLDHKTRLRWMDDYGNVQGEPYVVLSPNILSGFKIFALKNIFADHIIYKNYVLIS